MDYYDIDTDMSQYTRSFDSYGNVDSSAAAGLGAIFGAFVGVYLIIAFVIAVLQIVAMWKLYTKAGEKGWKSIIPIYNIVILFKICGLSPWLILVYFAGFIPVVGWIAIIALAIYQSNCLAKSFGKDLGYTVGLLLLPTIFYMILGFGKSEYIGPAAKKETVVEGNNETPSSDEIKKDDENQDSKED